MGLRQHRERHNRRTSESLHLSIGTPTHSPGAEIGQANLLGANPFGGERLGLKHSIANPARMPPSCLRCSRRQPAKNYSTKAGYRAVGNPPGCRAGRQLQSGRPDASPAKSMGHGQTHIAVERLFEQPPARSQKECVSR